MILPLRVWRVWRVWLVRGSNREEKKRGDPTSACCVCVGVCACVHGAAY